MSVGGMMFIPVFDRAPSSKPPRYCCTAMRAALRLRPPVLLGEVGRKTLGIAVYNTFNPRHGYAMLPRQAIRHCPWCGRVVNRWWSKVDYAESARYWAKQARKYRHRVTLAPHACDWIKTQLLNEDTYIVYGRAEGLLLPRFRAVHGGRLTGMGIPVWFCPGCGVQLTNERPDPSEVPAAIPLPHGTTHPRYRFG